MSGGSGVDSGADPVYRSVVHSGPIRCRSGGADLPRLDRLNRDVERTMAASGAPTPRRLLQAPRAAPGAAAHRDLAGAARRWWRAHSEAHPEARYAVARQALLELRRRGDLLLGMAPAEVAPTPLPLGERRRWAARRR